VHTSTISFACQACAWTTTRQVVLLVCSLSQCNLQLQAIALLLDTQFMSLARYEFYYDVWLKGQYTFKIRELHKQYGPIIRINPDEVHIADPDFYDVVYAGSTQKRDKWDWFCNQYGIPEATFATVGHDQHRMRRGALNPFFSKAKVRSLQPLIERVASNLLSRFEEFRTSGEPMTISLAFAALTNGTLRSAVEDETLMTI
jgi:hypothetical protein